MYNSKLVASIKVNGKILREFKDTVYIPFGSEYSILLKNLNTVRALVHVYIDGEDQVPGGLVLGAGQECDLQRSIKNNNLTEGNCFKFIERTGAVEEHRGIKLEDGLVRIEYEFERIYQRQDGPIWISQPSIVYGNNTSATPSYNSVIRGMSSGAVSNISGTVACSATMDSYSAADLQVTASAATVNETGITVPGSKSEQKFVTVSGFTTDGTKHSIVLKLLGKTENSPVEKPVTVKHKPKCVTCGKQNKATAKFCTECGTALEIFA